MAQRGTRNNLTAALPLLAKHFGVESVHVRMNNPSYEGIYRNIGVTNIARVTELLIEQFLVNIETPELRKVIGFGNLEIDIVNVPEKSSVVGLTVGDLISVKRFPEDVIVTCLLRDGGEDFEVSKADTKIKIRTFQCFKRREKRPGIDTFDCSGFLLLPLVL